jgi:hypothetical protein
MARHFFLVVGNYSLRDQTEVISLLAVQQVYSIRYILWFLSLRGIDGLSSRQSLSKLEPLWMCAETATSEWQCITTNQILFFGKTIKYINGASSQCPAPVPIESNLCLIIIHVHALPLSNSSTTVFGKEDSNKNIYSQTQHEKRAE